jgi:hypothetical protein
MPCTVACCSKPAQTRSVGKGTTSSQMWYDKRSFPCSTLRGSTVIMGMSDVICSAVDRFRKDRLNSGDGYRSVLGGFHKQWMEIWRRILITTRSSFRFLRVRRDERRLYTSHGSLPCHELKRSTIAKISDFNQYLDPRDFGGAH